MGASIGTPPHPQMREGGETDNDLLHLFARPPPHVPVNFCQEVDDGNVSPLSPVLQFKALTQALAGSFGIDTSS